MIRRLLAALVLALALACLPLAAQPRQELFGFVALGDLPYGPPELAQAPYQALIERINAERPEFSIHVGDFKSGSSPCSDEAFARQLANFQRFAGALVYTPGDNEWTDCHRPSAGAFDPQERLAALRQRFFVAGRSLGASPIAVENQSVLMPAFGAFIENQRWHHGGVTFATVHIVGSNNNRDPRDPRAMAEFQARESANAAWIAASFEAARRARAQAVVFAFQADVFESARPWDDFPPGSGFTQSVARTLLPLARDWDKPVLVIHGDTHRFRVDQPFNLEGRALPNVTRLIVPGDRDVRAVRVSVQPGGVFRFEPLHAGSP
jgi:hypothetical protein